MLLKSLFKKNEDHQTGKKTSKATPGNICLVIYSA